MKLSTSDHGEYLGDHGLRGKSDLVYDSVFNVPLVYRGPGINKSTVTSELVSIVDIMPTILDLLHLPSPQGVMGKSHKSLLEGDDSVGRKSVYAESPRMQMLRTKNTKYAIHPDGEVLFDLNRDPNEYYNLVFDTSSTDLLKQMRSLMLDKNFEMWDKLPEREANY